MVTEQEVRAALAQLPQGCFLKHYCEYAEKQSASHLGYHVVIGLVLLGITSSRTLVAHGFKAPTFGNFYGLVVGSSGDAEKTLAIRIAQDLLADAAPTLVGPDPTAEETLTKILANRPSQLFIYPDFASFLSKTTGHDNQRGQALRDGFMTVFDGLSYNREYSKGQQLNVVHPRVSMLGACTPRHLEDYTTGLDWQGGFMSRFFMCYGNRERDMPWPTPMPELRAWLVQRLAFCAARPDPAGDSLGLEPAAAQRWVLWADDLKRRHAKMLGDENMSGVVSRTRLMCAKIATLLAWSQGLSVGAPVGPAQWRMPESVLEQAIVFAELHLRSALALVERIEPTHEMREQRAVLNAVGTEWTPLGSILKDAKITHRKAKHYLETLSLQADLQTCTQDSTAYYRRVVGGMPRPYDVGMEGLQAPPLPGADVIPFPVQGYSQPV